MRVYQLSLHSKDYKDTLYSEDNEVPNLERWLELAKLSNKRGFGRELLIAKLKLAIMRELAYHVSFEENKDWNSLNKIKNWTRTIKVDDSFIEIRRIK